MSWSDEAIGAAAQAHAEADGFISPADNAWDLMRAALAAAVEVDGPVYRIAEGSENVYVVWAAIDRKHLVEIGGDRGEA